MARVQNRGTREKNSLKTLPLYIKRSFIIRLHDCTVKSRVTNNWTDWTNLLMAARRKDWFEFVEKKGLKLRAAEKALSLTRKSN